MRHSARFLRSVSSRGAGRRSLILPHGHGSVRSFVLNFTTCERTASGRPDIGADFRFYNLFTGRFISEAEARLVLRGMDRLVPVRHPTGWAFADMSKVFVTSVNDLQWLCVALDGLGDAVGGETDDDTKDS